MYESLFIAISLPYIIYASLATVLITQSLMCAHGKKISMTIAVVLFHFIFLLLRFYHFNYIITFIFIVRLIQLLSAIQNNGIIIIIIIINNNNNELHQIMNWVW